MNLSVEVLREAGLPSKFDTLKTGTFRGDKKAVTKIRQYVQTNFGKGLYIFGSKGTGKTFLASLVLRQAILDGLFVRYVSHDVFVSVGLETERTSFYADYGAADLLCVDNIETLISVKPVYYRVLGQMMQYRLDHGRPMILVSSLSPAAFNSTFGSEAHNILMRSYFIIHVSGSSKEEEEGRREAQNILFNDAN